MTEVGTLDWWAWVGHPTLLPVREGRSAGVSWVDPRERCSGYLPGSHLFLVRLSICEPGVSWKVLGRLVLLPVFVKIPPKMSVKGECSQCCWNLQMTKSERMSWIQEVQAKRGTLG